MQRLKRKQQKNTTPYEEEEENLCVKRPSLPMQKSSGAKGQTVCDERTINRTKTPEGDERAGGRRAEERSDNIVIFLLHIPGEKKHLSKRMEENQLRRFPPH